jgi:hypothetical protein
LKHDYCSKNYARVETVKVVPLSIAAVVLIVMLSFSGVAASPVKTGMPQEGQEQGIVADDAAGDQPQIILSGGWTDMGIRYGREAGPLIRENFRMLRGSWAEKPFSEEYLRFCISRLRFHSEALSPEICAFLKGVSIGAHDELQRAYAGDLTDFEKILFINCAGEILQNDWWHRWNAAAQGFPVRPGNDNSGPPHGFCWVFPATATFSRDTLCGLIEDAPPGIRLRKVRLKVVPDDGNALRCMAIVAAGGIASPCIMSRTKLYVGCVRVNTGVHYREEDLGVPSALLTAYMGLFCRDIEEASLAIIQGNEAYRQKTSRLTLLHSLPCNYLLAEPGRALVVERTARHYYLRGMRKEEGRRPALHVTDSFTSEDSFNEEGMRTLKPMSIYNARENAAVPGGEREKFIEMVSRGENEMTVDEIRSLFFHLSLRDHPPSRKMLFGSEAQLLYFGVLSSLSLEYAEGMVPYPHRWQKLRLYP